jgi:hypothetical protein
MGLSLRPLGKKITEVLHGVERQVNPFDNGATYSNPRAGAPPALPINRQVGNYVQQAGNAINRTGGAVNNAVSGAVNRAYNAPYGVRNITTGIGQGVIDTENQLAQGLLRYGAELAATGQQLYTHKPTTYKLTPSEKILFGDAPVQSQIEKTRSAYQNAQKGKHPGLAPVAAAGQAAFDIANDIPVVAGAVKPAVRAAKIAADATDAAKIATIKQGGTLEAGAVGKNVNKPSVELKTPKAPDAVKINQVDKNIQSLVLDQKPEVSYKVSSLGKAAETLSPNKQLRKVTQAVEQNIVNKGVRASLESGNIVTRTPGRIAVGVSRQAGRTPEEITRLGQYRGEKQLGDIYGKAVTKSGDEAVTGGVNRQAVHALLDPELSRAKGISVKPTEADVAEASRLKDINANIHEGNHELGFLNDKTYEANKGTYIRRDATDFFKNDNTAMNSRDSKLELSNFRKRKDLPNISDDVVKAMNEDPHYLTALNVQQYQRNKSYLQYSDWLADNGSLSKTPKKGYVQVPDSPAYGKLKNQYVLKEQLEDLQGFIYETDAASHAVALLNWYDRNPLRKARKSVLTIYNPGVRLGNRTFNYLVTSLNGINPVTFTKNYYRARKLIKANSPEYVEATRSGVFGSSIVDKELYRSSDLRPKSNIVKKAHNKAAETYARVDDEARFASYITFRERGLSAAEATQRTHRMLQDYDMVGHLFDLGAKTPIAGNAFIRFSSELTRIAHNTAVDNPLRAAGAAIAASTLIALASKKSGESPQDRKTREGRLGAPRVPFTNQSLEVQTPWGAVNAGRLLGLTTYNDLVGGTTEDVKRLTPFQSPVTHDKTGFHANVPGLTSDPLLGPVIGLAMNKDFRGKQINDPDSAKFPSQPLSPKEQNKNRLAYLKQSYVPFVNEVDSLKSSFQGKPNYYGKERTPTQAILRTGGVKVEQFNHKQAEEQRSKNDYFTGEYERAQDFLRKNPDLAPAYNAFKGREKVRDGADKGKKFVDIVTPERWKIVSADTSGKLYDFLKSEAETSFKKDGQPIDPVYQLPTKEQTRQILDLRAKPTGDDIEAEEILSATQPWYSKFKQAEKDYYNANSKFYDGKDLPDSQGPRAKAYTALTYPEQSDLIKQYYQNKNQDTQSGKNFYKDNADALSADFQKYRDEKLKYINAKRRIEGYPAIDASVFNNVTFGYEDDERKTYNELKYRKGYGSEGYSGYTPYQKKYSARKSSSRSGSRSSSRGSSGGSSGGSGGSTGSEFKYAVSLKSGGATAKPKVSSKKGGKKAKASSKTSQPKVTSKKSLV